MFVSRFVFFSFVNFGAFLTHARIACGAESMKRSSVRPSVRPSLFHRGFAAGAQQQIALSSKCGQCRIDSRRI